MAGIVLGRVVSGAAPLTKGKGVNDTYVGLVDVSGFGQVRAYIKDLAPIQLANELLAAGLAKRVGLPIPQPILAVASPKDLAAKNGPKSAGEALVFASTDEGAQSAMLMIGGGGLDLPGLKQLLANWASIPRAVAFDSWIANGDRHQGNFLLKDSEIYLVDHSHAFTGPNWDATSLAKNPMVKNRLIETIQDAMKADEAFNKLIKTVGECQAAFAAVDLSQECLAAHINGLINSSDITALLAYLTGRCSNVTKNISAELGRPRLT